MNLIEKATINHYHRHRIDAFGNGAVEALGWRGVESQIRRFEALCMVGDLNGCTLLDVGCGYGDLKSYLDQRFSNFTYIGIDQMPEFINEAKERHKNCSDTHFTLTDFTAVDFPRVDFVFASGALGYRCDDPDFYGDMIRKMYDASTRGVAFNMLDAQQFPDHPLLVGHDREKIVSFCRTLSPRVTVVHDYLADDFAVFMFRD